METQRHEAHAVRLLCAALLMAGCAHGYRETGVLLHEDGRYHLVRAPQDLFPESRPGSPAAEIVFDSRGLGLDRNYLRYRIVVGPRYFTVHERPDPIFEAPPGTHRIGLQRIDISTYVSGQTIRYETPEVVEFQLEEGDRVTIILRPGNDGAIHAELVWSD
jgi:hypothetical protein